MWFLFKSTLERALDRLDYSEYPETQQDKILFIMSALRDEKKEFIATDFMQYTLPKELFVGYEAAARLSELSKKWFVTKVKSIPNNNKYVNLNNGRYVRILTF